MCITSEKDLDSVASSNHIHSILSYETHHYLMNHEYSAL